MTQHLFLAHVISCHHLFPKKVEIAYHLSLFMVNRLIINGLIGDKHPSGLSLLITFFGIFGFIFDVLRLQAIRKEAPSGWFRGSKLVE